MRPVMELRRQLNRYRYQDSPYNMPNMLTSSNGNINWPFVRGIHRSPVNSPHKGQWPGALIFSLICTWTNDWVNNRDGGDLRCNHTHYDLSLMICQLISIRISAVEMRLTSDYLSYAMVIHSLSKMTFFYWNRWIFLSYWNTYVFIMILSPNQWNQLW